MLFAVVAWSDYADGMAARITGQYSRLGALLDPVVDRLLVIAGVVVCWHFELLPRWALAILIAREVYLLVAGRDRDEARASSSKINWPGRIAVWPTMSAIFFALVDLHALALANLYVGLALSLLAAAMYTRDARAHVDASRAAPSSSG